MQKMKMQVTGTSEGVKTLVRAGKHEVLVDEAEQMGGNNEGPNPLQYLLTALAGCTNAVAHMVAKEMEFDLQSLAVKAAGEFDPRGFMGDPTVQTYFETVDLDIDIKTSETEARLNELQEKVSARCPVYGVLAAADVTLNNTWTIVS